MDVAVDKARADVLAIEVDLDSMVASTILGVGRYRSHR